MGRVPLAFFLLLAVSGLFPAAAAEQIKSPNYPLEGAPRLSLPVDCSEAGRCSVQNYVDFAPGPKALDHTCGPLTYNRHSGIDIRLKSIEAMERGVAVLAAATGTVIASRNDVPDRLLNEVEARQALAGPVKPSNSVSLYHGNGWTTHYGHLRKGSVTVKTGQVVKRGQQLGLIGASGSTNFPHLHFTLLLRDQVIDPYSGRLPGSGCGAGVHHSFWNGEAAKLLAYRSSGVLNAGLAERIPSQRKIRRGLRNKTPLSTTADQIVFWTRVWGLRRNDRFHIRLFAANGALLAESTQRADNDNAVSIASLSITRRTDAWPLGTYRGEYLLERPNGAEEKKFKKILKFSREAEIR